MSGNNIAYHLRQNKAIERNLLIELLTRIGNVCNISDYEYIGFGGPFLEDHKALHAALRITRMHSIERDDNTYKRQQFNFPAQFVTFHHKSSDEFLREHEFSDKGTICWLDYTQPSDLKSQLDEFRSTCMKLSPFDVVKITLNAHPECLGGKESDNASIQKIRLKTLTEKIGDYIPSNAIEDDLTQKKYPSLLQRCIKNSVSDLSLGVTGCYFQILSSFSYQDGQQMLTVTGIMLEAADDASASTFLEQSRIKHWKFSNLDWKNPETISVPTLSAKERMRLDELLPMSDDEPATILGKLSEHLGFIPGDKKDKNELVNYARYYRAYPHFSRVIL
jgi:hypothetical protein